MTDEHAPVYCGTEYRAARRTLCGVRGYCLADSECHAAEVRDVTAGGVGLWSVRPFRPGTWFGLVLPAEAPNLLHPLRVRVEHATACPTGVWLLGCSFLRELRPEEVRALLAAGGAGEGAAHHADTGQAL